MIMSATLTGPCDKAMLEAALEEVKDAGFSPRHLITSPVGSDKSTVLAFSQKAYGSMKKIHPDTSLAKGATSPGELYARLHTALFSAFDKGLEFRVLFEAAQGKFFIMRERPQSETLFTVSGK